MRHRLVVTWGSGLPEDAGPVTVRRNRCWPFSTNVTVGRTIFEGGPAGINDPTLRHELTHVKQYAERGWWWVLTHPRAREQEARVAETAAWPQWRAR